MNYNGKVLDVIEEVKKVVVISVLPRSWHQ